MIFIFIYYYPYHSYYFIFIFFIFLFYYVFPSSSSFIILIFYNPHFLLSLLFYHIYPVYHPRPLSSSAFSILILILLTSSKTCWTGAPQRKSNLGPSSKGLPTMPKYPRKLSKIQIFCKMGIVKKKLGSNFS